MKQPSLTRVLPIYYQRKAVYRWVYETQEYCEDWQYDIYNDLLEEGVIKETVNGATFVKDYLFTSKSKNRTSLSLTAGVILCGSRNGWEYWTDSNNKRLNDDLELKKRLTNR